jgi:DNA-binding response OmpR family regulator
VSRPQRQITVVPVRMTRTPIAQEWVTALDKGFSVLPCWNFNVLHGLNGPGTPDVLAIDARRSRISVVCRAIVRLRKTVSSGVLVVVEAEDLSHFARRLPAVEFLAASASPIEIRARVLRAARHALAPLPSSYNERTQRRVGLHWRTHEVSLGNRRVGLTLRELQLFEAMLITFPRIVSPEELASRAWGLDNNSGRGRAAGRVCSLRKKLAWFGADVGIRTVRGTGYALESRYPLAVDRNRTR